MFVEPIREKIEDFIRRYGGDRVLRVLVVAVAVLLALLALRRLRMLAAPVLVGAILVVSAWLLVGSSLTIPRFSTDGPVVRNGVAAVMVCGEKRGTAPHGLEGLDAAMKYVPEPRTGSWGPPVRKGDCDIWYHRPPGMEQRQARQERAAERERLTDGQAF